MQPGWLVEVPGAASLTWAPEAARQRLGGKAAGLLQLRGAGLRVPEGWVVTPEVSEQELSRPEGRAALLEAVALLGPGALVVRSSATSEDAAAGRAPGVYRSIADVQQDGPALVAAVAAVRASLRAPLAAAYRAGHGGGAGQSAGAGDSERMAVLLQREVPGQQLTLYTRDPGQGAAAAEVRLERSDGAALLCDRGSGELALAEWTPGALGPGWLREVMAAVPVLEQAFAGPVDAELVVGPDGGVTWVQARPAALWTAPARASFVAPDQRAWRLDATHNPAPLSAPQAELVAAVEAGRTPAQVVLEGYLYVAEHAPAAEPSPSLSGALGRARRALARIERALSHAEAAPASLEAAYVVYRAVARSYFDELSPSLAALRGDLARELTSHGHGATLPVLLGGVPTWATERALALAAAGRALAAGDRAALDALLAGPMGTLAPSWDVATPSYREAPAALEAAARAAATQPAEALPHSHARAAAAARATLDDLMATLPRGGASRLARRVALAREAVRLGELDDGLFARAQAIVRRALITFAPERLRPSPDDARRAALVPPLRIEGGACLYPRPPRHGALRGHGGGGRARGPAFILSDASVTPPPGVVLVVATVLPAFAHLLAHAIALVTDHGGLLSHGAALARELGLPSVVGTGLATRSFHAGQPLIVDGDTGWVFPAPSP